MDVALLVIAKQPLPGRVKTRLCPPCTPEQAAALAEAALLDTLDAVERTPARRRVLVLDGAPGPWLPPGFDVIPQRGDGLGERLQAAFDDVDGPALLVGMDTPQLTPSLLTAAADRLVDADVVSAPTDDGGYWCVGFSRPVLNAFDGVPMSTEQTYVRQLERWFDLGLSVAGVERLRDVDTIEDARRVAAEVPESRFAKTLSGILASELPVR